MSVLERASLVVLISIGVAMFACLTMFACLIWAEVWNSFSRACICAKGRWHPDCPVHGRQAKPW